MHEGIIVCSDRRLRATVDRLYNNGRRVIVSTPGADVTAVEATVRGLTARGVRRWAILPHTDTEDVTKGCGWAARLEVEVRAALEGARAPVRYIDKEQVREFAALGFTSRREIEDHNLEVQTAALRKVLEHSKAQVERGATLDTSTMITDDTLSHVLVVTVPSALKYSSLVSALNSGGGSPVGRHNTFYLQVGHFDEVVRGARLLVSTLAIKDVRLLRLGTADKATMNLWKDKLQSEPFMRGVSLTLVGPPGAGRPGPAS